MSAEISTRTPSPGGERARPARRTGLAYVVDDDRSALEVICAIAEDAGWQCHGFTRLGALNARLETDPPDVLILDDDLPDGRGGDLARDLLQDPSTADLPVVVCTGAHRVRRAEITSWAPVVAKPFGVEELERLLDWAARRLGGGSDTQTAG